VHVCVAFFVNLYVCLFNAAGTVLGGQGTQICIVDSSPAALEIQQRILGHFISVQTSP
jgi:hypothetical protein